MAADQSVTQWFAKLRENDPIAAQRLWERYAMRLVEIARRKLQNIPKRTADEEDIAASVFHSLCRGAAAGRLQNVTNRDSLWWMLLKITEQKTADFVRRETAQKRGGGRVQPESKVSGTADDGNGFSLDRLVSNEPTPEFVVMLNEEHERLLCLLRDDRLRKIALFRIEGFSVTEIAVDLGVSNRSVERKLQLIRELWSKELQS